MPQRWVQVPWRWVQESIHHANYPVQLWWSNRPRCQLIQLDRLCQHQVNLMTETNSEEHQRTAAENEPQPLQVSIQKASEERKQLRLRLNRRRLFSEILFIEHAKGVWVGADSDSVVSRTVLHKAQGGLQFQLLWAFFEVFEKWICGSGLDGCTSLFQS